MQAMRMKVVMPTAAAPMMATVNCRVSDGVKCLTIPEVAKGRRLRREKPRDLDAARTPA